MNFHKKSTTVLHCYPNFSAENNRDFETVIYSHLLSGCMEQELNKQAQFLTTFTLSRPWFLPRGTSWVHPKITQRFFHDVSQAWVCDHVDIKLGRPHIAELILALGELRQEIATGLHQADQHKFNLTASFEQIDVDKFTLTWYSCHRATAFFIC